MLLPRVHMGDSVDDVFDKLLLKAGKLARWYGKLHFELKRVPTHWQVQVLAVFPAHGVGPSATAPSLVSPMPPPLPPHDDESRHSEKVIKALRTRPLWR